MSKENISIICHNEGHSEFPEYCSKLYLHFKGFKKISNLEAFKNIRTLYLENNDIEKIENIMHLDHL
jgi:hypothetical protein